MYGFVDINERGTSGASLSIQTFFNNINLDETLTDENGSFTTLSVTGRGNIKQRINYIDVPHMDGALESNDLTLEMRSIEVKYKLSDSTNEGFRERIDCLNTLLQGSKQQLSFTDESVFYYATLEQNNIPEEQSNELICMLVFSCSDPFKYGQENTFDFESDVLTMHYEGTTESSPIIELDVLKPSTFAMVQNQNEEYMLIGTPATDDVEIVDSRKTILQENGSTLDAWMKNPTRIDGWIGKVTGSFAHDGTGILVENFGTGDKMHGPALIKEITPTQDFEIESTFDIISNKEEDNYRMEFYMFDEALNMIGKMGINDNNRNITRRNGLARVGEYEDKYTRYLIGSGNYQYDNLKRVALMYLRVKRVGKKFTFYIAEIRNGKHYVPLTRTYTDQTGEFQNPLKYIQIYIGNWKDRNRTFRTRINYINVYELAQETIDQTPYIVYPGDTVTFNHFNKQLLINGEDRKDLKDFGGSFFNLSKGENQLILHPANSFMGRCKYRERYR
ncbi:distal tail protein Dit [Pontibacillus litoralis]|uniref:Siphovirus-type tail component C-terminal domain-containing protein n=1 Tax=Pontibacillus litoralis JSM 072002 TaxID=1385512 RepID=A0A0A5G7P6_9BACI|nr:distal tail protein Dit [Pontibacillus litoralis]KGX88034.1 hypothetical protein N784_12990 [Pontibacillus litoralis JSM 072002]